MDRAQQADGKKAGGKVDGRTRGEEETGGASCRDGFRGCVQRGPSLDTAGAFLSPSGSFGKSGGCPGWPFPTLPCTEQFPALPGVSAGRARRHCPRRARRARTEWSPACTIGCGVCRRILFFVYCSNLSPVSAKWSASSIGAGCVPAQLPLPRCRPWLRRPKRTILARTTGSRRSGASSGSRAAAGSNRFVHTNERFKNIYCEAGEYIVPAVKQFSWTCRDYRRGEWEWIHPMLLDLLFVLHWKYNKDEINIFSGYRTPETNANIEGAALNFSTHWPRRSTSISRTPTMPRWPRTSRNSSMAELACIR